MKTIEVGPLAEKLQQQNVDLIDVRTPVEFREVHAEGAVNMPLDRIDPVVFEAARKDRCKEPLYLICKSGGRSSKAAEAFIQAGFDHVVTVEGGTQAWQAAGLPVVKGKKAISLERQVRIAAGFLALTGAVLGFFVHPYFMGLSGFIGAGLMFAGITDTCGMGMMLSRMPWNQCDTGDQASCQTSFTHPKSPAGA